MGQLLLASREGTHKRSRQTLADLNKCSGVVSSVAFATFARGARQHRATIDVAIREARFDLDELSGRLIELSGDAALTAAFALVLEAQLRGEPAAYITHVDSSFYPPDVAQGGIDLDALVVIRAGASPTRARAADELLRSGAFAIVLVDLAQVEDQRIRIPPAMISRLLGLAQKHQSALVFLSSEESSLGSLISLRARVRHASIGSARHAVSIEVTKDKHRAPGWTQTEIYCGPMGLR